MSIPTQVSLEHRVHEIVTMSENPKHIYVGCECGYGPVTFLGHAAHVAEVAEGLAKSETLREAADSEEARCTGDWNGTVCDTCRASAKRLRERAARIERTDRA